MNKLVPASEMVSCLLLVLRLSSKKWMKTSQLVQPKRFTVYFIIKVQQMKLWTRSMHHTRDTFKTW
jgi:hypothetical protein